MDKQAKAGYLMSLDQAVAFYERCLEAEQKMGQKLTHEERENLLKAMQLGQEMTFEEIREVMAGKKVLIVKDKGNESL